MSITHRYPYFGSVLEWFAIYFDIANTNLLKLYASILINISLASLLKQSRDNIYVWNPSQGQFADDKFNCSFAHITTGQIE